MRDTAQLSTSRKTDSSLGVCDWIGAVTLRTRQGPPGFRSTAQGLQLPETENRVADLLIVLTILFLNHRKILSGNSLTVVRKHF